MVYLVVKDGRVIPHTDLEAMKALEGADVQYQEIPDEQFYQAEGLIRLVDGKLFFGKTDAEKQSELDNEELQKIKIEIASHDYRALKAYKLGAELDSLYPGESAWYQEKLDRVHELEIALGIE
jgi:hypothetical protein